MTLTEVDTSPLRAAREWRGLSLIAAARASGMHLASAEALEDGDPGEFGSTEEMVAAAVLYGVTLGIGRDEALALLDRTIARADGNTTPAPATPMPFSVAVRERSVRIQQPTDIPEAAVLPAMPDVPTPAGGIAMFDHEPPSGLFDVEAERTGEIPMPQMSGPPTAGVTSARAASELPDNPTVRAAMQIDPTWRRALEESMTDLEHWESNHRPVTPFVAGAQRRLRSFGERIMGPDRTQRTADSFQRGSVAVRGQVRDLRARLERSEHATLIVAFAIGLVLMAAMIAIASSRGGDERPTPAKKQTVTPPAAKLATPSTSAKAPAEPAKPTPPLVPARITLNVLNAGSRTGYAKEVAADLEHRGYKVSDVGNSNSRYGTSVILHPPSLQREAQRLSRQTSITTLDTTSEAGGPPTITIVVV